VLDEEIISSEFNLIHNEDLDSTLKNDHFDTESYLLESLLNRDTLMAFKIDSLLAEFAGELSFLISIPPGIDEANCDPEEDIRLIERLLYDNSSPPPIPNEDSDSLMEEIDLSFTPDDPMPPGIEEDDYDSERDILILKDFPNNDTLSLPENESFHFDIPSFSRPPSKPPDGNTGTLNIKMMGNISKQKPPANCPMMIHGKNIPILDVPLFHFYPLIRSSMGELGQAQRPKTRASWEATHAYQYFSFSF
nr:hypothetical protein [Tanacetum cinerariifolium]